MPYAENWEQVRQRLAGYIERNQLSVRAVAAELEMNHAGLGRIISGDTKMPHRNTRHSIQKWIDLKEVEEAAEAERRRSLAESTEGLREALKQSGLSVFPEDPVGRLLEYLERDNQLLATFMTITSAELDAEDRRKMAFAQLSALKRAYIKAGDPIPRTLFDLEKRFLAGE